MLAGIAIGSAIAAPLLRLRLRWLPVLAAIQCGIGFAAVLSFNMLAGSQQAIESATPWFDWLGINTYLAPLVVSSLIAMLPTTMLLGLAFPIGLPCGPATSERGDQPQGRHLLFAERARRDSRLGARRLHPAAATGHADSLIAVAALATLSSIMLAISDPEERSEDGRRAGRRLARSCS